MSIFKSATSLGFLLASVTLAPCAANAAMSDKLQDYSHVLPLSVSGKQGVVGFRLPQPVYLHARSAALNDLRVFDASGQILPFGLYVPPAQAHVQRLSVPVKVFPINATETANTQTGDAIDLDIKTAGDGTVVSVRTKAATKSGVASRLVGLVLDVRQGGQADSAQPPQFDALRFSLPPSTQSYSAQVWLEVSDDLKRWNTVGAAELSWLVNSDTQSLANDRLEFEPRSFRYARLTWRSGEPLQFQSVNIESVSQVADAPVLEKLQLQASPGKQVNDLVYRAAVAIPVEKIGLQFAEKNMVLPAALGQYRELPSRQIGQSSTWEFEPFIQATFFQITQEGQQRRSGDLAVTPTHAAQWVLRPQAASANPGKPSLQLTWQPATLIFLASGKPPYSLAFGRDKVSSATLDLAQVAPGFSASELGKLEQASAGALRVQQASATLESDAATASAAAQQRLWILWGVLLLGVAVLGTMAWRLLKAMK